MPGKVCSHPNKPLEKHLLNSLNIAEQIARHFSYHLSESQKVAILFHDLAKAPPFFQKKLCRNCTKVDDCPESSYNLNNIKDIKNYSHSEPSAAFILALTRDLMATEVIRRHHIAFNNLEEVKKFWWEDFKYKNNKQTGVYDLIAAIPWWPGAELLMKKAILLNEKTSWLSMLPDETEWANILDIVEDFGASFSENQWSEAWLGTRFFYSLLVAADRWEAVVGKNIEFNSLKVEMTKIDDYLKCEPINSLSTWRQDLRSVVKANIREVIKKPGVYTLTLPTGAGKTLIGLEAAMYVAESFQSKSIIYVLPFISLVEQNAEMASHLFDHVQEDHYLAYSNESSKSADRDLSDVDKFISFFRYWREPVIVTTLSKLWEVMFSPQANAVMSFHRLSNAVIVLDEPQSIPAKYWHGFRYVLELISSKLNTTIILMTATQPEIVSGIERELVKETVYFPVIRHEIHWLGDKLTTIDKTVEFLWEKGCETKDTLIVLNTPKSALLVLLKLRHLGLNPFFLSGWVTHRDRIRIITVLKDKERQEERRSLVATQVVEAGINLDFELVFRDLGPFDCLVQVAGRCNRHAKREGKGQVFIGELIDEDNKNERTFSSYVYDSILRNNSRNILAKNRDFDEEKSSQLVKEYYKGLEVEHSPLWENIVKGDWGEYYELFEQKPFAEEMLVVDYNNELLSEFEMIKNKKRSLENSEERRRFFRKLSQSSISVPLKYLEEWMQYTCMLLDDEQELSFFRFDNGIWFVRGKDIGRIYHPDYGFIPYSIAEKYSDLLREE